MSRSPSQIVKPPQGRPPRETIQLRNSTLEVDERDGYLHIVAVGSLVDQDDVVECNQHFTRLMTERGTKRALLDARGQQGEPRPEVRAAVWDWFKSDRAFEVVAYLVPESERMKAARINMTAVALGMNLRAFTTVVEAHRFLTPRRSSMLLPAIREPVEPEAAQRGAPVARQSSFPPALGPDSSGDRRAGGDASEAARKTMNPRTNRGQ